MRAALVGTLVAVLALATSVYLVRARRLRLKYAVIWLLTTVLAVVLAVFPGLVEFAASSLGFQVPVNLVFFAGIVLIGAFVLQITVEISTVEDKVERLAIELAHTKAVQQGPPGDRAPGVSG